MAADPVAKWPFTLPSTVLRTREKESGLSWRAGLHLTPTLATSASPPSLPFGTAGFGQRTTAASLDTDDASAGEPERRTFYKVEGDVRPNGGERVSDPRILASPARHRCRDRETRRHIGD